MTRIIEIKVIFIVFTDFIYHQRLRIVWTWQQSLVSKNRKYNIYDLNLYYPCHNPVTLIIGKNNNKPEIKMT